MPKYAVNRSVKIGPSTLVFALMFIGFTSSPSRLFPPATARAAAQIESPASFKPVVEQYCYGCHNTRLKIGGLSLQDQDVARVEQAPEIWEKVIRKLRTGMMPPA